MMTQTASLWGLFLQKAQIVPRDKLSKMYKLSLEIGIKRIKKHKLSLGINVPFLSGGVYMLNKVFIMPHPPIIIPEIGKGREKEAQKTIDGCRMAADRIADERPGTIIIISPHGPSYSNVVCIAGDPVLKGDLGNFGFRRLAYEFRNNIDLTGFIYDEMNKRGIHAVVNNKKARDIYDIDPAIDHGALVPLHYVLEKFDEFNLVHLATAISGPMDLYKCGMAIKEGAEKTDEKVVLIASSDLSHRLKSDGPYEYNPEGPRYDKFVVDCIKKREFARFLDVSHHMRECAGECGHRAISISLGAFEGRSCRTEVFSYEGPFGVGYMTAGIYDEGKGESVMYQYSLLKENKMSSLRKNESPYVKLARETIENYIKTGKIKIPDNRTDEKKGTFVSIKTSMIRVHTCPVKHQPRCLYPHPLQLS